MPTSEEAAVQAAQAAVVEGEETPSGEDVEVEETEALFPSFNIEIPPELLAELDEDDTDYTVSDEEIDALAEEHEEAPREILARMRAAEKRAEHLEVLRVKEARKGWEEEAAKFFPLAKPILDEIPATSRRAFLRTAKSFHDKLLPQWEESIGAAKGAQEAKKEAAVAEGKQEAREAWGQPVKTDDVPTEATVTLQKVQERRRPRELSDTIRNMVFPKEAQ